MDFKNIAVSRYKVMSRGHKAVTDFILGNMDEAAFMTAAAMAKAAGVSESTVVRYAVSLGYEGFPQLSAELAREVKGRLTLAQRLEQSYGSGVRSELVTSVLSADMERIADTIKMTDKAAFEAALDMIMKARRIYVAGLRQEAPLAGMLAFYLNMILGHTSQVSSSSMSEVFEQLLDLGEEDVVIGISFPKYSLRTLKVMEFANERRCGIISITDGKHSPMNIYSSVNLFARSDATSVVASLAAPLSLINALVAGLCLRDADGIGSRLSALDDIWKDFQYYGRDEME